MVKKVNLGAPLSMAGIIGNAIMIALAAAVKNFMTDLENHPECKSIDPTTREALTGYMWVIIFLNSISICFNLYIIFLK